MRAPSAAALLDAWETGLSQPPSRRALALLAAALPEAGQEDLARLSVGRGDEYLLALREQLFGPRLQCVSLCPKCGEKIEMAFAASDLRAATKGVSDADSLSLSARGYAITFRLPNFLDLEAAAGASDAGAARRVLLGRCVLAASDAAGEVPAESIPDSVVRDIADAMSRADPQAATEIALSCPACSHIWNDAFDIGSFVWAEVQDWAQHVLRDVHALAAAYGWTEPEILALPAARRRAYLDLTQS
jgi:hypothetical protein